MKKFTAVILSVIIAIPMFMFMSSAAYMGDADMDYKLTASDARKTLRVSVSLENFEKEEALYSADLNMDGKITADDARAILRASVGLEDIYERFYKRTI